jgi:hypothetical protein
MEISEDAGQEVRGSMAWLWPTSKPAFGPISHVTGPVVHGTILDVRCGGSEGSGVTPSGEILARHQPVTFWDLFQIRERLKSHQKLNAK